MSSIGSSSAVVVVDPATRDMRITGYNWSRQAVTLAVSGHNRAAADLVLVAYRRGVFVAGLSAGGFTGTTEAAVGTLDTNTEELEARVVGLRRADIFDVELQLWDSNVSSLELLGTGILKLRCSGLGYSAATGATPATPIVGSSGTLGTFGWKDGKVYFRNDDIAGPYNWFPMELRGGAGTMYIDYSQPGVSFS